MQIRTARREARVLLGRLIESDLLVGTQIVHARCLILRAGGEAKATWMVLKLMTRYRAEIQNKSQLIQTYANGRHIHLVSKEHLLVSLFAYIPQLGSFVHWAGYVRIHIGRQWEASNVASMAIKVHCLDTLLQVPVTAVIIYIITFIINYIIYINSTYIFISPDPVIKCPSSRKRHELRKPS